MLYHCTENRLLRRYFFDKGYPATMDGVQYILEAFSLGPSVVRANISILAHVFERLKDPGAGWIDAASRTADWGMVVDEQWCPLRVWPESWVISEVQSRTQL